MRGKIGMFLLWGGSLFGDKTALNITSAPMNVKPCSGCLMRSRDGDAPHLGGGKVVNLLK